MIHSQPQQQVLRKSADGAASVQDGHLPRLQRERLVVNGRGLVERVATGLAAGQGALAGRAAGQAPPRASQPNRQQTSQRKSHSFRQRTSSVVSSVLQRKERPKSGIVPFYVYLWENIFCKLP